MTETSPVALSKWQNFDLTLNEYGKPFFRFFVVFCIVYISALSNFTLSIDDETAALRTSDSAFVWLVQGRWTLYLIEKYFVSRPSIVAFPLMLFGMFASASYVLVTKAMDVRQDDVRNYPLFVIFCAFPTIFFITNFMANLVGLGIGMFSCSVASLLYKHQLRFRSSSFPGWLGHVILFCSQLILIATAVGAYESFLLLSAALYVAMGINHYSTHVRQSTASAMAWLLYAAVVVTAATAISLAMGSLLGASSGIVSSYVSGYLNPMMLIDSPRLIIGVALEQYSAVYGGSSAVYAFRYLAIPLLILIGFLAAIVSRANQTIWRRAFIALCLAGLSLVPFALHFVSGGSLPYRTLVAVPFVVWVFASAASFSQFRPIRLVGSALAMLVAIQCVYTLSLLQTNKRLALQHDNQVAAQVYERITQIVPDYRDDQSYPIDFYGAVKYSGPYQDVDQSTYSGSFFEWNGGNSDRIRLFFVITGHPNFVQPIGAQRQATMTHWQDMRIWPQPDSIRYIDGVILVRLGRDAGLSHANLTP